MSLRLYTHGKRLYGNQLVVNTNTNNNSMKYDYLIVGAGLFGATFAYLAKKQGKCCLVIDKRPHVGGNIYCEEIEGINVHKYGAHIFHTSDKEVWDFVNSIAPFNRYTNNPVAVAPNGKLYNLPFNMNTFYQMWGVKTPAEAQIKLDRQKREIAERMLGDKTMKFVNYHPRNLEEQALMLIGRDIYDLLIKGYTEKQWGRPCTELPPSIITRLPVRLTFDNNYFNDSYQGIPIGGYNRLIEGLLEGIEVKTCCNYFDARKQFDEMAHTIVYTGPIDRFFDYKFGSLEWRTVHFETDVLDTPNHQGNAVVNYTAANVPYTRIIEHKHFEAFGDAVYANPHTVISREYSTEWQPGMEPFYPVNDSRNTAFYTQYRDLLQTLPINTDGSPRYIFGGRLAQYKYYDMAPIVRQVLNLFK